MDHDRHLGADWALLVALVDRLPIGVLLVSAELDVLVANAAARELLAGCGGVDGFADSELAAVLGKVGLPVARESGRWIGSISDPRGAADPDPGDLEVQVVPLGPGGDGPAGVFLRPVTASQEAGDHARLLAAVVAQSTEFIAWHGPIGAEARINPAGAALVGGGVQPELPLPCRIRDLFTDPGRDLIENVGAPEMHRTGSWHSRMQIQNRDTGEIRDLAWSMFIVRDPQGRVLGSSGMARDVTEQVRAMGELERAHAELAEVYARTRELEAAKSRFFAKVSHELRTPLTLILAPLERLLDSVEPGELRRELARIERNAQVLLRQVKNLLDAARLEAGRMPVTYTSVDLAREVRTVAGLFESSAATRGIDLQVVAPERAWGEVDPEHLQVIVTNLLSNALKATPAQGVVRCELRVGAGSGLAVLEVADSGPGIAEEHREAVFELFRQLEVPLTAADRGSGLGLSIVRDLARLHGGEAVVSRAAEGGACVQVTLSLTAPPGTPVAPGRDETVAARTVEPMLVETAYAEPDPRVAIGDGRPLVVVVEDNRELNELLCNALAQSYDVASAGDGDAGLERVLALRPALVVCDVMMPRSTGLDLVRAVRANPDTNTTPILVLSARAEQESRLTLLDAGANDYLAKPFSLQELKVRAANLIETTTATERRRRALEAIDRERIGAGLREAVIADLFTLSLQLGGARAQVHDDLVGARLDEAVRGIDRVIHRIRATIFQTPPTASGAVGNRDARPDGADPSSARGVPESD
jgi:signal transduction histidine kinase/DNA-binding response OmpR family regulator